MCNHLCGSEEHSVCTEVFSAKLLSIGLAHHIVGQGDSDYPRNFFYVEKSVTGQPLACSDILGSLDANPVRFYTAKNTNVIKHFVRNLSEIYELVKFEPWQLLVFAWYSRQIAAIGRVIDRYPNQLYLYGDSRCGKTYTFNKQ